MADQKQSIVVDKHRTYMTMIQASVGTQQFQTVWADVDGALTDITRGGVLSCAFFVSGILKVHELITRVHVTVDSTIKDMLATGWYPITSPRPGAVLVWEPVISDDGSSHKHIGFMVDHEYAISNNSIDRVPTPHHWTYGQQNGQSVRKVIGIYWHDELS